MCLLRMYVCMHACMHVCICIRMCVCVCVCVCVCYICIHVCIYIHVFMYVYTYIYIYTYYMPFDMGRSRHIQGGRKGGGSQCAHIMWSRTYPRIFTLHTPHFYHTLPSMCVYIHIFITATHTYHIVARAKGRIIGRPFYYLPNSHFTTYQILFRTVTAHWKGQLHLRRGDCLPQKVPSPYSGTLCKVP